jgi:hypothetical protein
MIKVIVGIPVFARIKSRHLKNRQQSLNGGCCFFLLKINTQKVLYQD